MTNPTELANTLFDESSIITETSVSSSDRSNLPTNTETELHGTTSGRTRPTVFQPKERDQFSRSIRALREHCESVLVASKQLVFAAERQDPMDQELAGSEIADSLSKMWAERKARDEKWRRGLNFLQSATANLDFDMLNLEQAKTVQRCVEILCSSMLDNSDIQQLKRELRSAGLDPWNAISGNPE